MGKDLRHVRLVMVGMGAANVASYRLLTANGADPRAIIACDSKGTLHRGRHDIDARSPPDHARAHARGADRRAPGAMMGLTASA